MKKIYLMWLTVMFTVNPISGQNCSEIFISEYVEGSGNNKAMEFYNPTAASISMNNYRLVRFMNGSAIGTDSIDLVGTINSHNTFVIANGVGVTSATTSAMPACVPALQALAQQLDGAYPSPIFFNGDDAVALVRKSPYARIDIFGKIGQQPVTSWSDVFPYDGTAGNWWTKDHSLQRKATIKKGVIANPSQFNVTLEWDSMPNNNFSNLGIHACSCASAVVPITLTTSQQNITCNGNNNGVASVNVTSGTPPYTYSWSTIPAQTTQTITGLSAGVYTCFVSDAALNTATASVTIQQQAQALITSTTSTTIWSGSSVNLALTANLPSIFNWLASSNSNVTGMSLTTQTLSTINNTLTNSSNIPQNVTYTITPTATSGTCIGIPQILNVTVNPVFNGAEINVKASGVTVISGGAININANIGNPVTTNFLIENYGNSSPLTINSFSLTGTAASDYTVSAPTTSVTINPLSNLPFTVQFNPSLAGARNATLTINNNDVDESAYVIYLGGYGTNTGTLSISTGTNPTCSGQNHGRAVVNVNSGTAPFTYSWNTTPTQTTSVAYNLPSGSYNVIVTDAASNTVTANAIIPQYTHNLTTSVITNLSCNGNILASASVASSGSTWVTLPKTYLWSTSPAQTTQTVTGLTNGIYTVTVTDYFQCIKQSTVAISPVNNIIPPNYDSIQASSCNISHNGFIKLLEISAMPINGTQPFISEYYNGSGNDKAVEIYNPTNSVIDLASSTYSSVTVFCTLVNQGNATYAFPVGSLLQPHSTFVVAHPLANPSLLLKANATSTVIDGTNLSLKATSGPFTQIIDYAYITPSKTNRRKYTITGPNATLTPSEWLSFPLTLTYIGSHGSNIIYNAANTVIQWDVNTNNQTGASAFNLNPGTYGYTITDTITGCQYGNQVIVPSLGLDQFNANFSATQTLFTAPPFVAQFTNTTPNPSNYNFVWDFGDGTILSSNNATVFHQYQYNGLYTVKLIATAISTLCQDTMIKAGYIFCTGGVTCNLTASITPATNTNACAGDSIMLTCTNSGNITYQWYLNGTAINGEVASTFYATQSGNYQVAVTNSVCTDFSNQVTLTFNAPPQAPVITSTGNVTQCLGGSVVLNASPGYSSYLWSTGATSQSISVSASGLYSVTGNNSFGCGTTSLPYLLNFSAAPATPICLVTVDTTSLYNQVIWDKPITAAIDSFKIYRETMTNVFSYLNSVAYDSLSIYNDFAANPNVTSYKYKISAIDTCGNETLLSNYHNTIHLQYLGGGNLQWTVYSIENELNPVLYYMVLRDDNSSGNFLPISSTIPGGNSSFTDINFSSYPNAAYRVDLVWNRTCVPAKLTSTSTSISRSNVKHVQAPTNLGQVDLSKFVSIYPNPASTSINVRINTAFIDNAMLELYDATGKLITQQKVVNEYSSLNINGLANGIYTVRVITDNEQTVKRIVKQ